MPQFSKPGPAVAAVTVALLTAALAAATDPAQARTTCKRAEMTHFEPGANRPVTVCVSSSISTHKKYNFGPEQIVDSDPKTAWVEGDKGHGLGSWVELRFQSPQPVRYLGIENGFGKLHDSERWEHLARVKEVLIQTSDGAMEKVVLQDTDQPQYIRLLKASQPTWVRLTILSVYPGTRWADTALTEFWAMPPNFEPVSRDIVRNGRVPQETEPVSLEQ